MQSVCGAPPLLSVRPDVVRVVVLDGDVVAEEAHRVDVVAADVDRRDVVVLHGDVVARDVDPVVIRALGDESLEDDVVAARGDPGNGRRTHSGVDDRRRRRAAPADLQPVGERPGEAHRVARLHRGHRAAAGLDRALRRHRLAGPARPCPWRPARWTPRRCRAEWAPRVPAARPSRRRSGCRSRTTWWPTARPPSPSPSPCPAQLGVIANWASRASAVATIELRPVHPPTVTVNSTFACRAKPVASSDTAESRPLRDHHGRSGRTAGAAGTAGSLGGRNRRAAGRERPGLLGGRDGRDHQGHQELPLRERPRGRAARRHCLPW